MNKEIIKVYDEIAENYHSKFTKENRFLLKFAGYLQKNTKVLDVGCGAGTDTKFLIDIGLKVTSIDGSDGMLKVARKVVHNHKFYRKDIGKLNFRNNSFDGIVAAFSLQYLKKESVEKMLRKFHNFLGKNGVIYIALQEGSGEKNVQQFTGYGPLFMNFYTFHEIMSLLKSSGFEILIAKKLRPNKKQLQFCKLYVIARKVK